MKRRIIPDPILILITILAIIGFQVYWLKDNYDREKKTLQLKTNIAFEETVQELQSAKLKLPYSFTNDSLHKAKTRIFIDEDETQAGLDSGSLFRHKFITTVNNIRDKINDSGRTDSTVKSTIIFTTSNDSHVIKEEMPLKFKKFADTSDHIFNILYKVDSLQDSIKIGEIITHYSATLKKQNLDVPFNITRSPGAKVRDEQDMSRVVVGFAHPVTYQLSLVNTRNYLLKKIMSPILFSLFLVGVTILSFVLLYRNLLRQQRLSEIKNEFISNITHELKTPIATVGVAVEALKNFNAIHDPQKTKEYLDISSNELQRLSLLVDKVLKLSMFEKKEIELNKEPFDLKELVQEVLDTMRLQFEKNNAVVNFNSVGDNFIINADKLHITSVIYNLLDNALKYSHENLIINVELSQQRNNHSQNIFTLKVNDNGIGIATEYRNKIFDKFFRVPTGNKHAVKGYGLGLSYVSEIIKQHMGYIYVESELRKGSTFIAKLPAEEASTIWYGDKQVIRKLSLPIKGVIKKKI